MCRADGLPRWPDPPPHLSKVSSLRRKLPNFCALFLAALACVPQVRAATWQTSAGIGITETYSDNIASQADGSARSELVTEITPSIRLATGGGRLKLNLDASFHGLQYARGSAANSTQTTLNSTGRLELIDKWLYIDGTAAISNQIISPFGDQSTNLAHINGNRSQVRTLKLSPTIAGVIESDLQYNLRLETSTSKTDAASVSGSQVRGWTGGLRWGNNTRLLNWGSTFSQTVTRATGQDDIRTRSSQANLFINPAANLQIMLFVGGETNNYSLANRSSRTSGVNASWSASERTFISAAFQRQPYGISSQFSLSHRMPRSAWQFSHSRSASTVTTNGNLNAFSSDYQNLYLLCTSSGNSAETCATTTLQVLQILGRPVYTQLPYLTNSVVIQKSFQASVALIGVRNTVTVNVSRSDSRNDSATQVATDVFAQNSGILQQNFSLNWAFKASPFSTVTASYSRGRTSSSTGAQGDVSNISYYLMLSSQISQKIFGTLNFRHVENKVSSGTTVPYKENSVVGTLGYTY